MSLTPIQNGDSGFSARTTINQALAILSGPLPAAIRQVGTNCTIPTFQAGGSTAFMAASCHTICDDITSIAIETPWFYINSAGGYVEASPGGSVSAAAWIEYPRGTFNQFSYGGNTNPTIAGGSKAASDAIAIRVPRFAQIRIWHRMIASSGYVLNQAGTIGAYTTTGLANGGEGIITSGITGSSTPPLNFGSGTATSTAFRPCAIIATTTRRSFFVKGDSRSFGFGDGRTGGFPDVGEINRSLGAFLPTPVPYITASTSGDSIGSFIAAGTGGRVNQVALALYCSDNLPQVGINDITFGTSPATLQGQYATYKTYFSGSQTFWLSTKPPVSTSTDNWATTVNQTTHANNANRVTMNTWYRGFQTGYAGYFEVADPVESDRNSGLWRATGVAFGYTGDGTHETILGYQTIQQSGGVNTSGIQ